MKMREAAGKAIEEALKQSGTYKIVFVIALQSGRLNPMDVATIRTILRACPIIESNYGIIINKVAPRRVVGMKEKVQTLCAPMFEEIPSSPWIFVNPNDDILDDEEDKFVEPSEELLRFLERMPKIDIAPEEVGRVDVHDMDDRFQKYESMIADFQKDKEALQQNIARQDEHIKSLLQSKGGAQGSCCGHR